MSVADYWPNDMRGARQPDYKTAWAEPPPLQRSLEARLDRIIALLEKLVSSDARPAAGD